MRQILNKNARDFIGKNKKKILSLLAIGLVSVAGVGAYLFLSQPEESSFLTTEEQVRNFYMDTDRRAFQGDVDGALEAYDQAIHQQTDEKLKLELLTNKAMTALNNDRIDVAIEAAQRADDIQSDLASTSLLAQLYDRRGDKEKAIEYYKKALQLLDQETADEGPSDKGLFERRIQQLGGR